MPIDARIPLGVTGVDPNGFINALAAGQKQRELQNASERLAAKDEAAIAKTNALRKFYMSDRGPEAVRTLGMEAPDAVSGIEKNTREAGLAEQKTKNLRAEGAKADLVVMREASGALVANPTDENFEATIAWVEPQLSDPSVTKLWRSQWTTARPEARKDLATRWAMSAEKAGRLALAEQEANGPVRNTYTGEWEYPPGSTAAGPASTTPPAAGAAGPEPVRPGTVVPGGELPPPEDIKAEQRHRAGQGPAPAGNFDYEGLSDAGLDELQATSTFQKGQKPPALPSGGPMPAGGQPAPVDGHPAPVDVPPTHAPPAQVGGGYRSPMERDAARDQRQGLRDAAADQRYAEQQEATNRRLDLQEKRFAEQEKRSQHLAEVQAGVRLTPADASKVQQKLVRADAFKRQLANLRAAWEGVKNAKTGEMEGGIKDTKSAGPGAGYYTYTEAGEKFDKALASVVGSKTALLRVPGVGTMTDLDQMIESADLPSRSTFEGTTEQQLVALENLVNDIEAGNRALLAEPPEAPAEAGPAATPPPSAPVEVSADKEPALPKPVQVAPLEDLDSMPLPGKYAGKWLTTPEGIRYRSDGSKWIRQ